MLIMTLAALSAASSYLHHVDADRQTLYVEHLAVHPRREAAAAPDTGNEQ